MAVKQGLYNPKRIPATVGSPVGNDRLTHYLNKSVRELITLDSIFLSPGQKERHRIYSLMLMALVYHFWNGNKRGRNGQYPWNENVNVEDGEFLDTDYIGHNIASICVDGDGLIIDFDFNHNKLFNSSVEHAEARLIRRVFNLTQLHDSWNVDFDPTKYLPKDDYTTLENVTVYTSLESCSQCAGIMALGRVKELVYLQSDPGMYLIGNILRNLTQGTKLQAPLPIAGSQFDLNYFEELNNAYNYFNERIATEPFHISKGGKNDHGNSITSFLCTKIARDIYSRASYHFKEIVVPGIKKLEYPNFRPLDQTGQEVGSALTNEGCLKELSSFFNYAIKNGRRGTPH